MALAFALGGCATAPETQPDSFKAPPAPARQPLSEIDALEHDLKLSEARLLAELERQRVEKSRATLEKPTRSRMGPEDGKPELPAGSPTPAPPVVRAPGAPARPADPSPKAGARAPPAKKETKSADDATEAEKEREQDPRPVSVGSPCDLACRALASMQRAADGICSIAGPADARCQSAKERVRVSGEQVTRAGCACRAEP